MNTDLLLPISKPRRVCIGNAVELARYGYTPGRPCCEAAMGAIPWVWQDHPERCALSDRVRGVHARMSREDVRGTRADAQVPDWCDREGGESSVPEVQADEGCKAFRGDRQRQEQRRAE